MKDPLIDEKEEEEEITILVGESPIYSNEGNESTCLPKGSLSSSIWILASVSLGVGIFVQPSVFYNMGYAAGSAVVILFAVVTAFTQYLFILSCNKKTFGSYGAAARNALGNKGLVVSSIFMAITCFIAVRYSL